MGALRGPKAPPTARSTRSPPGRAPRPLCGLSSSGRLAPPRLCCHACCCPAEPCLHAGIGLLSVRGSGTSGYVQTNRFNLRGPPQTQLRDRDDDRGPAHKKPNEEILEHNRKRQIELEVETMRAQLEDEE